MFHKCLTLQTKVYGTSNSRVWCVRSNRDHLFSNRRSRRLSFSSFEIEIEMLKLRRLNKIELLQVE